jgi:1,2-diacylglycerol 3-alpha-glucosyltransferase
MGTCCLVYLNLGPHHVARIKALASVLPAVRVVELAGSQRLYPWSRQVDRLGTTVHTAFPDCTYEEIPTAQQVTGITTLLQQMDPEVVVLDGYGESVSRAAARWAQSRRIPTVLRFVSTYADKPRSWWKEYFKSRVIAGYAAIAATGQLAARYARALGGRNVCEVGNPVDNSHFHRSAQHVRSDEDGWRRHLGLPRHYFLTVSRLAPEKNLLRLVVAYDRYRKEGGKWDLVMVGGGPQKEELHQLVRTRRISGMHLVDWSSYDGLPTYYSLASCFVLPSVSEPWGLVINEAMACGLPIIASRNCGCAPDLCRDQVNGYVFDPRSEEELTRLLHRMAGADGQRVEMGQASRRIIDGYDVGAWAESLATCVSRYRGVRTECGSERVAVGLSDGVAGSDTELTSKRRIRAAEQARYPGNLSR